MLTLSQAQTLINDENRDLQPIIKRWRQIYYGMSLHICGACPRFYYDLRSQTAYTTTGNFVEPAGYFGEEYQQIFSRILLNRHPREDESTRNWRYSQYRPFTKDAFIRVIDFIAGAIFQDSNYSIELPDKEENKYIWENNFGGYDIAQYFAWSLQNIFSDPNGFFLRIPKEPYNATTTPRIMPEIWFINTRDIEFISKDEIIFSRGREEEKVMWFVNKIGIFRFVRNPERNSTEKWVLGDIGGYYAHQLNKLPIDVAGGVWNEQGHFDSWLDKAKAVADEFVSSKSAEQLVDKEASHPYIIMAQEDCPTCQGVGRISRPCSDCPQGVEMVTCGTCDGAGHMSNNPGERLLVPREDMKEDMVKIVNPTIDINNYHKEKNNELYDKILDALNLLKVDAAQSGVAKTIDQERLYMFVSKISNDLFDRIIYNSITDIVAYRNVDTTPAGQTVPRVETISIVKPTQYQIKTGADLLIEYGNATAANVPPFIRVRMMNEYVDKQFGGDEVMKRKSLLIGQMDPYCTYTVQDKAALLSSGAMSGRDYQFSAQIGAIMDTLIREEGRKWFLSTKYEIINAEILKLFAAIKPIEPPAPTPPPAPVKAAPDPVTSN